MSKLIILGMILSMICLSQAAIQLEQGEYTAINIQQEGELGYATPVTYPKEQVFTVSFKQKFDRIPKVAITTSQLGWYTVDIAVKNTEYKVYLKEVTLTGFKFALYQNFASLFYRLVIQYAATNDPFFQVYYLDIGKKGEDKTVNFTNTYAETPSVTTFLLGASLDDIGAYQQQTPNNKVTVNTIAILKDSCKVNVNPGYIFSGHVVVIAFPTSRGSIFETKVADTILGLLPTASKTIIGKTFTVPIPTGYSSSLQLFGITGYEFKVTDEMRAMLWNKTAKADGTGFTIEGACWGVGLGLKKLKFSVVFYQPKDECAFLFTECEYQGNYSPVCPEIHQPTFSTTPFKDNDVKSIYIPENKKVTLYELENFEGMQATFETSQNCLSEIKGQKQV